jgi:hypothetical protein
MLESLRNDARHATRGLLRSPVFSLTAILSLAIGGGGTAAIYSGERASSARRRGSGRGPAREHRPHQDGQDSTTSPT